MSRYPVGAERASAPEPYRWISPAASTAKPLVFATTRAPVSDGGVDAGPRVATVSRFLSAGGGGGTFRPAGPAGALFPLGPFRVCAARRGPPARGRTAGAR